MGNKIAMVNVADEYGIESANISRKLFPAAGFELVYDKSYPLGTQDYAPVIKGAKATNPDAFIAYSYPPDTFRPDRSGQDRKLQSQGLLQRHRLRVRRVWWEIWRRGGECDWLRRRSGQREDSRLLEAAQGRYRH